jgi:saccharopine dehydrogenase-like NADP-dependent oxidoreductase
MRILLIGAGGVGEAIVKLAVTRHFYEQIIVADYDLARAEDVVAYVNDSRFAATQIDAGNAANIVELCRQHGITHILNAVEPKFVPTIFSAAFTAGANYMDMAMSLSEAHESDPFHQPGIKLGDAQYAVHEQWERAGKLALVGMGVEPGLSNVFARYAQDYLFSEIDEISVKDGSNLVVRNEAGEEIFAPSFSIWTTIEECLNPPLMWSEAKGFYTTQPFSEPEIFDFPEGIGSVECVNVEHEEVAMLPRTIRAKKFSFKYGLGREFIQVLKTLNQLGLDRTKPTRVRSAQGPVDVSPRDVVAAVLPNPASIGPLMTGKTCAGVLVTGKDKDGRERATYLYNVVDNEWSMANYQSQCVVWQTAFNPLIALELMAQGIWRGAGVLGPECFDPKPFLDLMSASTGYQVEWKTQERLSAAPLRNP